MAQKAPNAWGLYDMLGIVWEWCSDWYGEYKEEKNDPTGPASGVSKVLRGGSWFINPGVVRVSFRYGYEPSGRYKSIGFRCGGELP